MSTFRIVDDDHVRLEIFGSPAQMTRQDGVWSLSGRDFPAAIRLDQPEADAAVQLGQHAWERRVLADNGLDPQHEGVSAAVQSLRAQVGKSDSVLLDTTTLSSAGLALSHGPGPTSLLDLSTVTNAFVLHDQVVVQDGSVFFPGGFSPGLNSALKILEFSRTVLAGMLWSANVRAANYATQTPRNDLLEAWRAFLGRDDISLNRYAWDDQQSSSAVWDGVPASNYLDYEAPDITLEGSGVDQLRSLNDYLSIQTIRALFNDSLATILEMPYIPTSIRSPVYGVLLKRKVRTQQLADRLLGQIGPSPLQVANDNPYVQELSVPFLLGVVFSRMRNPGDYLSALEEVRDMFAPLRERILADRAEWSGRSAAYVADYVKYIRGYIPSELQAAQEIAAGTAAIVTAASPYGGSAVDLAIKVMRSSKAAEKAYSWYLKRFKPYIYVGVEMAAEARALRTVEHEIERLWGSEWTREDHDRLERLSVARPEIFSRLRRLDGSDGTLAG